MIINDKRELAYTATITDINPIENYDRVEYATINDGWRVIVSKEDNFKVGDVCIYFEVDSKVPEDDARFSFLSKRKYRIKTLKMCGVLSQGLVMSLSLFPEITTKEPGTPLTDLLNITYYVEEDNQRKSNKVDKDAKYKSMSSRHINLARKKWWRWLMRREWGRKLLFIFFGKKKDTPRGFPSFIKKTDEERIENMPWILDDKGDWIATEKLDGTSCTYALERKGRNKFEFYVCSRNVRQRDEKQNCYHDHNIYWDLAFKYDIENHLKKCLEEHSDWNWVCIQGEGVGSVQGNPLKLKEDDLYVFNFIDSQNGRYPSQTAKCIVESWGMKHVPILGVVNFIGMDLEMMKHDADGQSVVNPDVMREGIVYRDAEGNRSFKNVSNKYLLSKK